MTVTSALGEKHLLRGNDAGATGVRINDAGGWLMLPPLDLMDQGRLSVAFETGGAAFGLWQPKAHHGFPATTNPGPSLGTSSTPATSRPPASSMPRSSATPTPTSPTARTWCTPPPNAPMGRPPPASVMSGPQWCGSVNPGRTTGRRQTGGWSGAPGPGAPSISVITPRHRARPTQG